MSTAKKNGKPAAEELQAALQSLIEQGKKEGMIRAADLNAHLEKTDNSTCPLDLRRVRQRGYRHRERA